MKDSGNFDINKMKTKRKESSIQYPTSIISYAQNGEDIILNRAFMGKKNGFYIDVGAGKPNDDSVTKNFYDLGWRGINIEPHPDNFQLLNKERKNDINLNLGIANKNELRPFYILKTSNSWGLSSFDKNCIQGLSIENYDKINIKTQRLGKVIDDFAANEIIDFLKIDVEGYEHEVLSSIDFEKYKPRILVVESVLSGSNKPTRNTWIKFVEKYYVHGLFDGLNDYFVLPNETFLFNQLGSMVNLFDGVDNRISCENLRNNFKLLDEKNRKLLEQIHIYKDNDTLINKQNKLLVEFNDGLEDQNKSLKDQNKLLEDHNKSLEDQNELSIVETKLLESELQKLSENIVQLEKIHQSVVHDNCELKDNITKTTSHCESQSSEILRLRNLLYKSNFAKHLYRAWRVLRNDPHYTIDCLIPERQLSRVSFWTHVSRLLVSLFCISSKPWHTHLYRCLRNLLGDEKYKHYKIAQTKIKKKVFEQNFSFDCSRFNEVNLNDFNNEDAPLLSICITTYNRSDWLNSNLARLLSILKPYQSLIEVVVCDNASTDNTDSIIQKFNLTYNFTHKCNDKNVGMLGNLSETENLAKGKFIWLIGDDDHINIDCLDHILKVIILYPEIHLIYTNYSYTHIDDPSTEISELERTQQIIAPVSESRFVHKLSQVAANTPNFFTAIYCCIFRNDHAKKCYNQDTSGRPFSSLLTCVPTTKYTLENLLDKPAYWYGSPAILVNMNVSWLRHADLWVLERFPEIYNSFQTKGVSLTKINQYRNESINGVVDHLARYLDAESENLDIINLESLFSSYLHLESFKNALPTIKNLINKYPAFKKNVNFEIINCKSNYNIKIEGPFVGSYSLSQVNRRMACNLDMLGHNVMLSPSPTEGSNFTLKSNQIDQHSYQLYNKGTVNKNDYKDITLRYTFPPTINDMGGKTNMYHSFGWEESRLPFEHVENLNKLDAITVMSSFVKKALEESGVYKPIFVTGLGIDEIYFDGHNRFEKNEFTFLHVSSCFDRKGVDVLLKSYFSSFNSNDSVRLIIKTFPNPHNNIDEEVLSYRNQFKNPPRVSIINEDWTKPEKLKSLYEKCDVLIAPSRGEGFCLPIGEALLRGIPVIATAWGGHMDILGYDYPWLIDFKFSNATSHLSEGDSYWVEPCEKSLSQLIIASFNSTDKEREKIVHEWQRRVSGEFTWENSANKVINALRIVKEKNNNTACTDNFVGVLTPWAQKCGIYEYSKNLLHHFNILKHRIYPYNSLDKKSSVAKNNVYTETWFNENENFEIKANPFQDCTNILIHHQPSFFTQKQFLNLVKNFIDLDKNIFIIIHNVRNFVDQLSLGNNSILRNEKVTLLVHTINDLNLMKEKEKWILFKTVHISHGITNYVFPKTNHNIKITNSITISTFGFLLPNKGVYELIDCISILKSNGLKIKLNLFTSLLDERSISYFEKCNSLINDRFLNNDVFFSTEHLDFSELLPNLAESDLLILPYLDSTESCSGALRTCLSVRKPIICSKASIFDDVRHVVNTVDCVNSDVMAVELMKIINNETILNEMFSKQLSYTESNKWEIVAQRLESIMLSRSNGSCSNI